MNSRHQIDDHISANRPDEGSGGNPPHFVVAIGASAGGLEAIHDFFDKMPESSHLSFIIIQHLSPDYKSLLVDLVSRHTHMKVFEAEHNLRIQRNCIYVIPNNKLMTLKGYKLKLTEKLPPMMAIDLTKHNIRVNALAPGWFKTELNEEFFDSPTGIERIAQMPARRLGKIEELVGPVVMLASDAGSFINGSVIAVDGALNALIA